MTPVDVLKEFHAIPKKPHRQKTSTFEAGAFAPANE